MNHLTAEDDLQSTGLPLIITRRAFGYLLYRNQLGYLVNKYRKNSCYPLLTPGLQSPSIPYISTLRLDYERETLIPKGFCL